MRTTLISIALLLFSAHSALASHCLRYEPAIARLSGVIKPTMFYGPPNFGEEPKTDEKGIYPVLVLDKSLCVAGDANSDEDRQAEHGLSQMQMVFFAKYPFQMRWNNRHVQVTGKLFHADNAFHHTEVLIMVDRVSMLGVHR